MTAANPPDAWPHLWVVIPTYNERLTIGSLLARLQAVITADILIVDDNSPDGTAGLIKELQGAHPNIHLLSRPKKNGLSSAYRQGLQEAIDRGAALVVHMDADGSHDPALIPAMLNKLSAADLVLGSRYVAGGHLAIPWYRRWISAGGNWYIRLLLGRAVHDWSTGYKAWRAPLLRQVLQQPWQTVGYACLIEMSWLAKELGGRLGEVPLKFIDRRAGQSKFSPAIMIEDLRVAGRLRGRQGRLAENRKRE